MIHNIELYPGKGAQLVRSAGVAAQLMAKENGMVPLFDACKQYVLKGVTSIQELMGLKMEQ